MIRRAGLAVAFLLVTGLPCLADGTRAVVPISQSVLPDGDIRYSIQVSVGDGPPIEALLDTGSTGLRILPHTIADDSFVNTGFTSLYAYGSGDTLAGVIATAPVGIGGLVTDQPIPIEMVNTVGCAATATDCGAARLAPDDYRIGGDGIAGQGFQAIIGVSLVPAVGTGYTENPLSHLASRWIIQLPEPGSAAAGSLILNPADAELQGYQSFKLARLAGDQGRAAGWMDLLPGCLQNLSSGQNICGPTLLDTGSPGIIAYVQGATPTALWSAGDNAMMSFNPPGSAALNTAFTVDRFPGSGLLQSPPNGGISLVAGMLPFYAYSVLYDANAGVVGLEPRPDAPNMQTPDTGVDPATQIEVIKMNTPGPPAAVAALPQVITPNP